MSLIYYSLITIFKINTFILNIPYIISLDEVEMSYTLKYLTIIIMINLF